MPYRVVKRDEVLNLLSQHRREIEEYGVEGLALFGSVARDEAGPDSDIDLLVEFHPSAHVGIFRLLELQEYLEGILGHRVDLVSKKAVKPRLQDRIFEEAITAA